MANHLSHALSIGPVKGARFTQQLAWFDASGDLTDPVSADTQISLDGGITYNPALEEVTTAGGTGFITFSGEEMNNTALLVKAGAASGPKTTVFSIVPLVLPVLYSGTAQAGAAGSITLATDIPAIANLLIGCVVKTTGGTGGGGTGGRDNQARVITGFTAGRAASVTPDWETTPDGTTTYEILLTEFAYARLADLVQIDGQSTSGNNATLNLKQLNIVNSAGSAIVASSTGSNGHGIAASGNGSGTGATYTGGATGIGFLAAGGSTSGNGAEFVAATSGHGFRCIAAGIGSHGVVSAGSGSGSGWRFVGGATGPGMLIIGGGTSGPGISITTTLGDGVSITPTAGHAVVATGNGTDKHGLFATGGTAGTSDGIKAVAGTGGVDIRGNVIVAAAGLDAVLVDGVALPAALQYIAASGAGLVSGAGTGTEVFKGLDGVTTRLTITVDSSGNRSVIVYG